MLNRRKYTDLEIQKILKNMIVLIDSREKANDHITSYFDKHKIKYEIMALPSGDYSFALEAIPELDLPHKTFYHNDVLLERKNSLEDLSGCFAQRRVPFNHERSLCYAKR